MRRTSGHNGLMKSGNMNALLRGGESRDSTMSDGGMDTGSRTERRRRKRKSRV
jgi:hypothetical protein